MSALYVFAITRDTLAPFDVDGHVVESVRVGGIAAAVERVDHRPRITEAALRRQHEIVLRIAGSVDEILPARFGAFVDAAELEQLVALRREAIEEALDLVRGRVQMTLRFREGSRAADQRDRPRLDPESGTAYLEARRAATMPSAPPEAGAIDAAVTDLVAASRQDRHEQLGTPAVYHLIARGSVDAYLSVLSSFQSSRIVVSGPWPPFAFAPDLWP